MTSQTYSKVSQFWLDLHLISSHFWSLLLFAGSCCPSAPGAGPVPRHRRSTGGPERTRQAVGRPDLRRRVHQHGGHRDTRTFGGERHPVSGQAACLQCVFVLSCNPVWWGKSGWFVSCSFGEMLAFTLTAFLELMDHGIVSWDLISLSFIKQVPPQPQGTFIRTTQHVSLCRLPAEIHGQFFFSLYSSFMSLFLLDVSGCCCQATAHIMQTSLPVYEQLSLMEKCCTPKWCGVSKADLLFAPDRRLLVFSVHAQIAGYVNQPMVDVSILQRSLAILESMVLNSHSLYHRVAQEITVGQLIGHLQVWAHTHAQGRHALWWTEELTSFC